MNLSKPQKFMAAGQFNEALALLPPVSISTDPRADIIRARIAADTGHTAEAVHTLTAVQTRYPAHAPSGLFRGIYLLDLHRPDQAIKCFDEVLTLQKNNDLAKSYRALCQCALGDGPAAADAWRKDGFSDNAMFRVRTAEFIESSWLRDKSYVGELPHLLLPPIPANESQRKALRHFYRRNFREMLNYVPPTPTDKELQAFLAATAHEMLRQYSVASSYIEPFLSRRDEWPDPLTALNARLMVRRGEIAAAARELSGVILMGPEDFGVNYYLGIICLAYDKAAEARQYFLRAFTNYMVDTLEFQWWQIEQTLLHPELQQRFNASTDASLAP